MIENAIDQNLSLIHVIGFSDTMPITKSLLYCTLYRTEKYLNLG